MGRLPPPPRTTSTASLKPMETARDADRFVEVFRTSRGTVSLVTLEGAVILVLHDPSGQTLIPAYSLSAAGLRAESWLLSGLVEQSRAWGFRVSNSAEVLPGRVEFAGNYPVRITRSYGVGGDAPGACCSVTQSYENGSWTEAHSVGEPFLNWTPCAGRPFPANVRWPNGVELWECFECTAHGTRSILFRDRDCSKRAQRQRQHLAQCGGEPRLSGSMSPVALADGGLLTVGNDCRTNQASFELFSGGALSSIIAPLPGKPGSLSYGFVAASDPVLWAKGTAGQWTVAFPSDDGEHLTRPYVARFDGRRWTDISPLETSGVPVDLGYLPDGKVWLLVEPVESGPCASRRFLVNDAGANSKYNDVLSQLGGCMADGGLWFSLAREPWLLMAGEDGDQSLVHRRDDGAWEGLQVPHTCQVCAQSNARVGGIAFLDNQPIIALVGNECACVLRVAPKNFPSAG